MKKKTSEVEQFREPLEITIAFAGDVMMEASIDRAMQKHGFDYPFSQVREDIEKADYAIVNLETAVTNQTKSYDKQFNFKTGPESLVALKEAGFDMVSLANNHTMDYREEGLVDTINYLNEVGLAHVGAGRNKDEAFASHTIELKGKKISFLGFSRVLPSLNWYATDTKPGIASGYQLDQMIRTIEKEKKEVDYLFVYIHWGIERNQYPEHYQFEYARAMIDAGADGIIGAHPHVFQGLDYYNGKPIAYSLGNFLFPDHVRGLTAESGLLTLQIKEDEITMQLTPYHIANDQVSTLSEEAQEERLQQLEKLSFNVKREGDVFTEMEE
ncbi:MAG: CapA family protein [Bacillaceae bacterium]|nr:CapA family protein [Bacillaceae bacterium]